MPGKNKCQRLTSWQDSLRMLEHAGGCWSLLGSWMNFQCSCFASPLQRKASRCHEAHTTRKYPQHDPTRLARNGLLGVKLLSALCASPLCTDSFSHVYVYVDVSSESMPVILMPTRTPQGPTAPHTPIAQCAANATSPSSEEQGVGRGAVARLRGIADLPWAPALAIALHAETHSRSPALSRACLARASGRHATQTLARQAFRSSSSRVSEAAVTPRIALRRAAGKARARV